MKKDLIEIVFILDRSGSMSGLEQDTIGGFNGVLQKQKQLEGEVIVSTVLFDDRFELLHNRQDIKNVKPITQDDYFVRGSTALLDAIGRSLKKIKRVHQELNHESKPEKTLFVITTDGQENSSQEYSFTQIKKLIEQQSEKEGWEFIFLGANMDAIATASQLGINKNRAACYKADREGVSLQYEAIDAVIENLRARKVIDEDWKKDISGGNSD